MDNKAETINYHGHTIDIYQDMDYDGNPNDWNDGVVFLVAYHRDFDVRYDEVITKDEAIAIANDEMMDYPRCKEIKKNFHLFGLEAYIHSGVVLALSGEGQFPDRKWDVSQLGFVLVAKKEAKTRLKARKMAEGLISNWNDNLSGNVYGYIIDEGEGEGSCWGFYGDWNKNGLVKQAKDDINAMIEARIKKNDKRLKAQIKNGVSINNRQPAIL